MFYTVFIEILTPVYIKRKEVYWTFKVDSYKENLRKVYKI